MAYPLPYAFARGAQLLLEKETLTPEEFPALRPLAATP